LFHINKTQIQIGLRFSDSSFIAWTLTGMLANAMRCSALGSGESTWTEFVSK